MQKKIALIVTLCALSHSLVAQNVPPVNPSGIVYAVPLKDGTPNYHGYFEKIFKIYSQNIRNQALIPGSESALSIEFADEALRLWQVTGDDAYRQLAQPVYDSFVAQPNLEKHFEVFNSYPLGHATLLLNNAHHVSAAQLAAVRSAFLEQQAKGYLLRYGNRELGVMSGACFAAFQLFPHDPDFAPTRDRMMAWWKQQSAIGDLDENAGNYSSVGLVETIRIVRAMGREDDLRSSARWRNTFARLRAMVSPSGHFPEFNDDYFEEGGKTAYLYLFEYAAALYSDSTFSYAARKLYLRRVRYLPPAHNAHADLHEMGGTFLADDLLDLKLLPQKPLSSPLVTGITHRYDAFGIEHADKLFLRSSLAPGAPMLMMELYSWGDHAHQEMRGSITYYEVGSVPLFRGGFGRYWGRQTGDGGNAFYLQQDRDTFPLDTWKPGAWKTVRIEASRLPLPGVPGEAPDQSKRLFTGLTATGQCHLGVPGASGCYATKPYNGNDTILIDNIRLEGPAGTKALQDFEADSLPRGTQHSDDASHGSHSLAITPAGQSVTIPPPSSAEFSLNDYKVLAYDIKQTGNPPMLTDDFRIPNAPNGTHMYEAWHTIAPSPFYAALASAITQTHGQDGYAEVYYDGYGTWDSKLVRRIVFTQEGIIVVRDTFTAGATAAGWTGGAVWQIPGVAAQGKNWFLSTPMEDVTLSPQDISAHKQNEIVYFASTDSLEMGITKQLYQKQVRYSVWARLPLLAAGKTVSLVTIVLPGDEHTPFKSVADSIRVTNTAAGAHVQIPAEGLELNLTEKEWDIQRNSAVYPKGK